MVLVQDTKNLPASLGFIMFGDTGAKPWAGGITGCRGCGIAFGTLNGIDPGTPNLVGRRPEIVMILKLRRLEKNSIRSTSSRTATVHRGLHVCEQHSSK